MKYLFGIKAVFVSCLLIFTNQSRSQLTSRGITSGPMIVSTEKKINTTDGKFGVALNFKVTMFKPNHKAEIFKFTKSEFVGFISIRLKALSIPYLLDPTEWQLKTDTSTGKMSANGESGWSSIIRYGKSPNDYVQKVIETDEKSDPAYEYRWRLSGSVINENNMEIFSEIGMLVSVTIEIQRKSYFSSEFKPVAKLNRSKRNVNDQLVNIITSAYNSYFQEKYKRNIAAHKKEEVFEFK